MPKLSLNLKYGKNNGMILSPTEVKTIYLYGIRISSTDGSQFSDESFRFYIKEAQKIIENYLSIKIVKQMVEETTSYYKDSYINNFPIMKTLYIVNKPLSMIGLLNTAEQVQYPEEWLSAAKKPDGIGNRRISVVPTGSVVPKSGDIILTGIMTQLGLQRLQNIPDYWSMQYITGFDLDQLPSDVIGIIGKLATFGPLGIAGDLILGSAGIASQSLSIDGLSQSINTTSSATSSGYGARILLYQKEIKDTLGMIKNRYKGFIYEAL